MSTTTRAFKQVDVFTADALKCNPVAVILDAEGLTAADMQAIASWTNLSETTFVIPATDGQADYAVRIFTPKSELPFAGHPTLGTAHAVIEAGLATPSDGTLVQQCAVGLVEVSVAGTGLSFRLPRYAFEEAPEPERLVAALGDAALAALAVGAVGSREELARWTAYRHVIEPDPHLRAVLAPDHDRFLALYAALSHWRTH